MVCCTHTTLQPRQTHPCYPGIQVVAHMMPDLPNVGWERDMESFREFFENPDFRCAVGVGRAVVMMAAWRP